MPGSNLSTLIRITFYEREHPFTTIIDESGMATAYVQYAQLCGYGITLETKETPMPIMWMPTASSVFDAIAHDPTTNELHVRMKNGKRYVHRGVTADDHQRFVNAESMGRHYNSEIKNKFAHELVNEDVRQSER